MKTTLTTLAALTLTSVGASADAMYLLNLDTVNPVDTTQVVDTVTTVVTSTSTADPSYGSTFYLVVGIVLGLYEVAVRYVPTVKDLSVLSYVMKFLQAIVPNKKKGGGTHAVK